MLYSYGNEEECFAVEGDFSCEGGLLWCSLALHWSSFGSGDIFIVTGRFLALC